MHDHFDDVCFAVSFIVLVAAMPCAWLMLAVFFFPLYLQQICNHFALTNGQLSVENRSWKFPAKFLVFIVFISEFCKLFHPPATEAIVRNSSTICHHSNMINLINFPLPVDKWERGKRERERAIVLPLIISFVYFWCHCQQFVVRSWKLTIANILTIDCVAQATTSRDCCLSVN